MKYNVYEGVMHEPKHWPKLIAAAFAALALSLVVTGFAFAASSTMVPGHAKKFVPEGEDYPPAGQYVNGHYTALYAYDDTGAWYWDLGDGRVQGTVTSVDELDEATLTTCKYVNNYRADFGGDPYMDHGWIQNHIKCSGYDGKATYNYLIVSSDDPRYTGNPDNAVWGSWEYIVNTQSGEGNMAKAQPEHYVNE